MPYRRPSTEKIVRIVLERPGPFQTVITTVLNEPEVNQTKPEHHLAVRSVQIARGTRLRH